GAGRAGNSSVRGNSRARRLRRGFDEIACLGGIDVELSVRLWVEPWFAVGEDVGRRGCGRVWRCRDLTTSPSRVVEDGGKGTRIQYGARGSLMIAVHLEMGGMYLSPQLSVPNAGACSELHPCLMSSGRSGEALKRPASRSYRIASKLRCEHIFQVLPYNKQRRGGILDSQVLGTSCHRLAPGLELQRQGCASRIVHGQAVRCMRPVRSGILYRFRLTVAAARLRPTRIFEAGPNPRGQPNHHGFNSQAHPPRAQGKPKKVDSGKSKRLNGRGAPEALTRSGTECVYTRRVPTSRDRPGEATGSGTEDSNPEARFKGSTSFGKSGSPVDWFPLPPVQRPHSEQPSIQSNPNPVHAFRSISFPFTHPVFLSDRIDWHGRPVGHNGRLACKGIGIAVDVCVNVSIVVYEVSNCTLAPLPVIIHHWRWIDHCYFRGFGKGTPMYGRVAGLIHRSSVPWSVAVAQKRLSVSVSVSPCLSFSCDYYKVVYPMAVGDRENNGDDCVHREEEWGKTMEIAQRGKLSDAGINPFSMMLPCSQYVRPINLLPPDRDAYLIASGGKRYGRSSIEGMSGAGGKARGGQGREGEGAAILQSGYYRGRAAGVTPHLSIPPTRYECHESAKNRAEVDRWMDVLLLSFSYDYLGVNVCIQRR
ncbi:uncharacterized protein BO96DRAFT_333504, partial [Aspergillus niger CBS 101883]|uniref:uncharacterized protein n=1 Tax=Aspergillus lacticoffeatus (strain CBS 101883) TaxID=1450533 RepID=UPI000D8046C0